MLRLARAWQRPGGGRKASVQRSATGPVIPLPAHGGHCLPAQQEGRPRVGNGAKRPTGLWLLIAVSCAAGASLHGAARRAKRVAIRTSGRQPPLLTDSPRRGPTEHAVPNRCPPLSRGHERTCPGLVRPHSSPHPPLAALLRKAPRSRSGARHLSCARSAQRVNGKRYNYGTPTPRGCGQRGRGACSAAGGDCPAAALSRRHRRRRTRSGARSGALRALLRAASSASGVRDNREASSSSPNTSRRSPSIVRKRQGRSQA